MNDRAVSPVLGTILLLVIVVTFVSLIGSGLYLSQFTDIEENHEVDASYEVINIEDSPDEEIVRVQLTNVYQADFATVQTSSEDGVVYNEINDGECQDLADDRELENIGEAVFVCNLEEGDRITLISHKDENSEVSSGFILQ